MGFFEILLIAVVTLLVVGPERMPEAVRSTALTIGRIKRMFNAAREEVEKQVGADEIRLQLHNEEVMESLAKVKNDLSDIDKPYSSKPIAESTTTDSDNLNPDVDNTTQSNHQSANPSESSP